MNKRPAGRIILAALIVVLITSLTGGGPELPAISAAQEIAGAEATVGLLVSYQGRLLDPATGQPKPDGAYTMTFAIYNVEGSGTPIWTETKSVLVSGGLFTVLLGDTVALTPGMFNGQALWLGVKVGSDPEATPRQRLTVVPYAAGLIPGATMSSTATGALLSITNSSTASSASAVTGVAGGASGLSLMQEAGVRGEASGGFGVAGLSSSSYGGYFESAAYHGVYAKSGSPNYAAIRAYNGGSGTGAYGVEGMSATSYGGFFSSSNDQLDLALGGPTGRINSDPDDQNSNLVLSSNNDLTVRLDNDGGENSMLRVKDSGGSDVATVDEAGNLTVTGAIKADKMTYTTARTGYFSVGGEAFVPGSNIDYTNTYGMGGACINSGSNALVAAVHLPQGATVTAFRAFFNDNSSNNITAYLERLSLTGGAYLFLAEVNSTGISSYGNRTTTSITAPTIDNTVFSYHVYAWANPWDCNMKIMGAVVTYTVTEAP